MEKTTIIFEDKKYDYETVASYFDNEICASIDFDSDEPQRTFEQYLEADPTFAELFEYDFTPVYED